MKTLTEEMEYRAKLFQERGQLLDDVQQITSGSYLLIDDGSSSVRVALVTSPVLQRSETRWTAQLLRFGSVVGRQYVSPEISLEQHETPVKHITSGSLKFYVLTAEQQKEIDRLKHNDWQWLLVKEAIVAFGRLSSPNETEDKQIIAKRFLDLFYEIFQKSEALFENFAEDINTNEAAMVALLQCWKTLPDEQDPKLNELFPRFILDRCYAWGAHGGARDRFNKRLGW